MFANTLAKGPRVKGETEGAKTEGAKMEGAKTEEAKTEVKKTEVGKREVEKTAVEKREVVVQMLAAKTLQTQDLLFCTSTRSCSYHSLPLNLGHTNRWTRSYHIFHHSAMWDRMVSVNCVPHCHR